MYERYRSLFPEDPVGGDGDGDEHIDWMPGMARHSSRRELLVPPVEGRTRLQLSLWRSGELLVPPVEREGARSPLLARPAAPAEPDVAAAAAVGSGGGGLELRSEECGSVQVLVYETQATEEQPRPPEAEEGGGQQERVPVRDPPPPVPPSPPSPPPSPLPSPLPPPRRVAAVVAARPAKPAVLAAQGGNWIQKRKKKTTAPRARAAASFSDDWMEQDRVSPRRHGGSGVRPAVLRSPATRQLPLVVARGRGAADEASDSEGEAEHSRAVKRRKNAVGGGGDGRAKSTSKAGRAATSTAKSASKAPSAQRRCGAGSGGGKKNSRAAKNAPHESEDDESMLSESQPNMRFFFREGS